MNKLAHKNCCEELFTKFQFENMKTAKPPPKKGVYAIRVKQRGKTASEIVARVKPFVGKLGWPLLNKFIFPRIERIQRISECPTIYIGSAGTRPNSKNTLLKRYEEFSNRHTAMYPIGALMYFGWELEYGWIEKEDASIAEAKIKERYQQKHDNKLPAIVER